MAVIEGIQREAPAKTTTRRHFISKGIAGVVTVAVFGAEAMVRPDRSRAGLGDCHCQYFYPEGYTCAYGVLYLVGLYLDCYAHTVCKVEWIAVGCCNG